jgi:hypothetical protein
MYSTNCIRAAAVFSVFVLMVFRSDAAVRVWDGSAGTNWSTAANWSNGVAPAHGDILVFPNGAANRTNHNNFASLAVNRIEISDSYTFSGNRITLTNGILVNSAISGVRRATFGNPMTLGADQTFTTEGGAIFRTRLVLRGELNLATRDLSHDGPGTLEIAGPVVRSSGSAYIFASGDGAILLSGTNGFGEGDFSDDVIGSASSEVQVGGFWTNASVSTYGTFTGTGFVHSVTLDGGQLRPSAGPLTIRELSIGYQSPGSYVAELRGTEPVTGYDQVRVLEKLGYWGFAPSRIVPVLSFSPALGDSFQIVKFDGTNRVGQSTIGLPGVQSPFIEEPVTSTNGYSLQLSLNGGDGNDTVLTVIRAPGSKISIWDSDSSQSSISNKLWSRTLNWEEGILPSAGDRLLLTGVNTFDGRTATTNTFAPGTAFGLSFQANGFEIFGNAISLLGDLTNRGAVSGGFHLGNTVHVPLTISSNTIIHSADLNTNGASVADLMFSGPITASGSITKEGTGTLAFLNTNSVAGTLFVNNGGFIARAPISAVGGYVVPNTLTIGNATNSTFVLLGRRALPPDTVVSARNAWLFLEESQTVGPLTLEGATLGIAAGKSLTLGGNVAVLSSPQPSRITNAVLNLNSQVVAFNVADGAGAVDMFIYMGVTGGTISKTGNGTLEIFAQPSAAPNDIGMNVLAGTLLLNSRALSATVSGGTLAGNGTLLGTLTGSGGRIVPGNGTGRINVGTNLTLSSGATLELALNGLTAGVNYGQLSVTGAVNLGSATLDVSVGFASAVGNTFVIVANGGSDAVQGTFAGLPEGATLEADGSPFQISYVGGTGNDVVLTRVQDAARITQPRRTTNGFFEFFGRGEPGLNYVVQANTNLNTTNWLNISTNSADPGGLFQFIDTNATIYPMRFYRLMQP